MALETYSDMRGNSQRALCVHVGGWGAVSARSDGVPGVSGDHSGRCSAVSAVLTDAELPHACSFSACFGAELRTEPAPRPACRKNTDRPART